MGSALLVLFSVLVLGAATRLLVHSVRQPVPTVPRGYSQRAWKLGRAYRVAAGFAFFVFACVQAAISIFSLLSVDGLW